MSAPQIIQENSKIILFDGVCNLCSAFLSFVYQRDKKSSFQFAWLQSQPGEEISQWLNLPADNYKTIIYIEEGIPYFKSTAFMKIVKYLKFPWPVLAVGFIVPKFIRDWAYDLIAENRYQWFGKKDRCMMPTGDLKKRFL